MSSRAKSSTAEPRWPRRNTFERDDREHDRDGRPDEHRRGERVERGVGEPAHVGVDLDRDRLARRVGGQERGDHEVVDRRREHDHQAGEDGRAEQRQDDRAQRLHRGRAEVLGRLLEVTTDREQAPAHDDHDVGHRERDVAEEHRRATERDRRVQVVEDEEQHRPHHDLGRRERHEHEQVRAPGDRATPPGRGRWPARRRAGSR